MLIRCDDDFECNAIHITLLGKEKTHVTIHVGKVTVVYTDEVDHIDEQYEFSGSTRIPSGEHRYEFKFTLPGEAPGSYKGAHGNVKYTLEAKVEVSWARDPKCKMELQVQSGSTQDAQESTSKSDIAEDEGIIIFRVECEKDIVELGKPFRCRAFVDQVVNIRGVRAELVHIEFVEPDGYKATTRKSKVEYYIEDEDLRRDTWVEIDLQTGIEMPLSFKTSLIDSSYVLKVTLDIPRRLDTVIEIPITVLSGTPAKDTADEDSFW